MSGHVNDMKWRMLKSGAAPQAACDVITPCGLVTQRSQVHRLVVGRERHSWSLSLRHCSLHTDSGGQSWVKEVRDL